MIEIQPIIPTAPITKPVKVTNDEDKSEKKRQQDRGENESDRDSSQDQGPAQHIDEIV